MVAEAVVEGGLVPFENLVDAQLMHDRVSSFRGPLRVAPHRWPPERWKPADDPANTVCMPPRSSGAIAQRREQREARGRGARRAPAGGDLEALPAGVSWG